MPAKAAPHLPAAALRPAGIWVVPADVQDPVSHFEQLKLQTHLPPLMDKDVMYPVKDAGFPRHYVLLHDAGSGDEKK